MEDYIEQTYLFGNNKVVIISGTLKIKNKKTGEYINSFPHIDIAILKENKEIDRENLNLESDITDYSRLIFKNIESLKVMEDALEFCRKKLEIK
jgi:hypothetical protein